MKQMREDTILETNSWIMRIYTQSYQQLKLGYYILDKGSQAAII